VKVQIKLTIRTIIVCRKVPCNDGKFKNIRDFKRLPLVNAYESANCCFTFKIKI
jgi:hypothetical protein